MEKSNKKERKMVVLYGNIKNKTRKRKKNVQNITKQQEKMKQDYKKSLWNKKKVIDKITFLR